MSQYHVIFFRRSKSKPDEKKQKESKSSRRSRQTVHMDIESSITDTAEKDVVTAVSNNVNETAEAPTAPEHVPEERSKRKRKISCVEGIQEDNNSIVTEENSRKRVGRPSKNPPPISECGTDKHDENNTKSKKRKSDETTKEINNQTEINKPRRIRQLNEETNIEANIQIQEAEDNMEKSRRGRQLIGDNMNVVSKKTVELEENKNKPRRGRQLIQESTMKTNNEIIDSTMETNNEIIDSNMETNNEIEQLEENNKNKPRRSKQGIEDNKVNEQTDESKENKRNKPRRSKQVMEDNMNEVNDQKDKPEENNKNKPLRRTQVAEENTKEISNEIEEPEENKKNKPRRSRTEDNAKENDNLTDESKPRRSRILTEDLTQVIPEIPKNGSVSEPNAENRTEEELPKRRGRQVSEKKPVQVNKKSKTSDKSKAEIYTHEPPQVEEKPQAEEEYEIEKIIDKKGSGRKTFYLVKWKGYDKEEDNTWEPLSSLREVLPFIEEFERIKNAIPVMEGIKRLPTPEVKMDKKSRGASKKNKVKEVEENTNRNEDSSTVSKNLEVKKLFVFLLYDNYIS